MKTVVLTLHSFEFDELGRRPFRELICNFNLEGIDFLENRRARFFLVAPNNVSDGGVTERLQSLLHPAMLKYEENSQLKFA